MESGFIFIDKPKDITSYDVIRVLKKILPQGIKIGHSGTLDPLATGLLIVGIGRDATKKLGVIMKHSKTYRVGMLLGKRYDTQDITGTLLEEKDASHITKELFEEVLKKFQGIREQIPPMYSAIKHEGQPLYKKARKGEEVVRHPRSITIDMIKIISWEHPHVQLIVQCSSGTYIRTLVDDIGSMLGVGAVVEELRRTHIDSYSVENAKKIDELKGEDDIRDQIIQIDRS